MSRRFIYLINPVSGTRQKQSLSILISEITRQQGFPFEILHTLASGDYQFLEQKIEEEKITDVVICGGDGTVNQVVYPLAKTGVRFGLIPMGSGNGLALAARISREPRQALDTIFSGAAKLVDGFLVNNQFACMLCGLGFDAVVAHEFAANGKRGLATYAKLATKHFFSAKPYLFGVEANNLQFNADAYFISIANSNQFGNNFTIAPQANLSDGLLDVVIVKKTLKPMLLFNVLQQVWGGRIQKIENSLSSPVIYFQTDALKIDNRQLAPMHIDGDPRESPAELEIQILPQYFNLIQPL
ncbi:MAG TPA: diacylglycerol kinase family protein [Chitinophagaceae bacterium]|nr:diacylglycerol kinase family protein [Chitinophagaceae bacterium]